MSYKKTFKSIIRKFDLFSHPATFRYNQQPAYQSVSGGLLSICLIFLFAGIFATTLIKTFNKEYINFNESHHDQVSPSFFTTSLDRTFMFALGLQGIDVNQGERYFDLYMQFRHYNSTHKIKQNIPLKPCQRADWQLLGFQDAFDRLNMTRWLCPDPSTVLQLQGKFTSDNFKFYKFAVTKCSPALDLTRPCANNSVIQSYLNANQAFNFNYYFINTILNPGDEFYTKKYLQDVNYFPFSPTDGINANLFVSSYEINTDDSLWPVEDIKTDVGGIVKSAAQMVPYKVRSSEYVKFFLRKSPLSISIERSFRRVDDTFSYIGGLFSTILVFLGFMNMYNQLSYEMEVLKNSFDFSRNDPFNSDQFNILSFFVYLIYSFLEKFSIEPNWEKYKRIHTFVQNGKKQLDMRLVMKKILYAQRLGSAVLDQTKHKALLLAEPFTLDQAQITRKQLRFYKNFRKKFFPSNQSVIESQQRLTTNDELLITSKKNSKVMPLPQDSTLQMHQHSEEMSDNIEIKQKPQQDKPSTIRHQEEFSQIDKDMKLYMIKLYNQVQKNDPVAKRIFEKIDSRIKRKYLGIELGSSPKKIKLTMKLNDDLS